MSERLIDHMPDGLAPVLDVTREGEETPQSGERFLVGNFIRLVKELDFGELVHLVDDHRTLKNKHLYKLDSLISGKKFTSSLDKCGDFWRWPSGVNARYRVIYPNKYPFLDTSLAIGLVYKGRLNAVAGAGVDMSGTQEKLLIRQIQGMLRISGRQDYKESGLHTGLLWPDMLVQAWIELAKKSGIGTVAVQAAINNDPLYLRAVEKVGKGSLEQNYDKVAERMGFVKNLATGNWERQI